MFYVPKKILLLLYMHVLFCTHYPYFICFIAVILNTLYAFYVLSCCFTLFCWKIAQIAPALNKASCILYLSHDDLSLTLHIAGLK